jgi:hypothetical protein
VKSAAIDTLGKQAETPLSDNKKPLAIHHRKRRVPITPASHSAQANAEPKVPVIPIIEDQAELRATKQRIDPKILLHKRFSYYLLGMISI